MRTLSGSLRSPRPAALGTTLSYDSDQSFKQRGVVSEVVRAHQPSEVDACKLGPTAPPPGTFRPRPRPLGAAGFALSQKMRKKVDNAVPVQSKLSTVAVVPKVIEVYNHKPGNAPRPVIVERKVRDYEQQNIEELLDARGISFRGPNWNKGHWLKLEYFDNTEFELRTPQEWMAMSVVVDGERLPLRGKGLRLDPARGGRWQDCVVREYNEETSRFKVHWVRGFSVGGAEEAVPEIDTSDGTDGAAALSRLQLLFRGEDPRTFANRIEFAFSSLERSQSRIKLNYFIDHMPVEDIETLSVTQLSRLVDAARNTQSLRDGADPHTDGELIKEVNLDFARAMNKITLAHSPLLQKVAAASGAGCPSRMNSTGSGWGLFESVNIDDLQADDEGPFSKPVPWRAILQVPEYKFVDMFKDFCFASLHIKPEVMITLCSIREECLWLLSKCIYAARYQNLLKLEHFRQLQRTTISQMAHRTKDAWVLSMQKIILKNLPSVGKGWFSIHETNVDTFRKGKIKKLLTLIRFIMQDVLRFFSLDSVGKYCQALEAYCPDEVKVCGLAHVESQYPADIAALLSRPTGASPAGIPSGGANSLTAASTDSTAAAGGGAGAVGGASGGGKDDGILAYGDDTLRDNKGGLFLLELRPADDRQHFVYSTQGSAFVDAAHEILDMGLQSINDVPLVDSSIVPQFYNTSARKQVLLSVGTDEPWVEDRRATLVEALEQALPSLDEYFSLYKQFEELLRLDPAAYVKEIVASDISVEDIRMCILEHQEKQEEVLNSIPESIVVGLFSISVSETRKILSSRHKKICDLLLDVLLARFRESAQEITDYFNGIFAQLRKAPKNIESSIALRKYMSAVPAEVQKAQPDIARCLSIYAILESFSVHVLNDDAFQRWRVFGCPKQTYDLVDQVLETTTKLEVGFLQEMAEDQADFDENTDTLSDIINTFATRSDLANLEEIYDTVKDVDQRIQKAHAQAKLINSRELLFCREQSDYSRLQQVQEEWEPYSALWHTVYTWRKHKQDWMDGNFSESEARNCQIFVSKSSKELGDAARAFEQKLPACAKVLQIAKHAKGDIDDSALHLINLAGLVSEDTRERPWTKASDKQASRTTPASRTGGHLMRG